MKNDIFAHETEGGASTAHTFKTEPTHGCDTVAQERQPARVRELSDIEGYETEQGFPGWTFIHSMPPMTGSLTGYPLIPESNAVDAKQLEQVQATNKLNQQYAFVKSSRGVEVYDLKHGHYFVPANLAQYFTNQPLQAAKGTVFTAWQKHLQRRSYENMKFAPGKSTPADTLNLWEGWGCLPVYALEDGDEDVELWLDHIYDVICGGDDSCGNYLVQWLAHLVQQPHEKPGVALVMQGGQGAGKGIFVTLLQKIIGERYTVACTQGSHVTGQFSSQLMNKLLVFFDEATWGGHKDAQGRLKALVTEKTLAFEEKGKDVVYINDYMRLIIASNESFSVPVESDDRRYFVPNVSNHRQGDKAYFQRLADSLTGGIAPSKFFHFLLNVNLANFSIRQIPDTMAKHRLKYEALLRSNPYRAFLVACAEEEEETLGFVEDLRSTRFSAQGYECFKTWLGTQNKLLQNAAVETKTKFTQEMQGEGFSADRKSGRRGLSMADIDGFLQKHRVN